MKGRLFLLSVLIVANGAFAQDQMATPVGVQPRATPVAQQSGVNEKKSKKNSEKSEQQTTPVPAATNQAIRIDEMVNKLVQLKMQSDPANPPTGYQIKSWKSRLTDGEDYLTLSREIKEAAPKSVVAADPDAPHFDFTNGTTFDYGEIMESNDPAAHDFVFVNTGKKPLIISEAHGSCGCTVPTYSKEPVLPGQKGVITVKYSSRGRIEPISKDVSISSNAYPAITMLHISGTVKANPEYNKPNPVTEKK